MDIAALKKNRKGALERLNTAVESQAKGGFQREEDNRFWQPKVDESGNGYAVIRFLPEPPNEDYPWIKLWSKGFQAPGGWYIENCLTTIGQADPVVELCSRLWATGHESDKELAKKYKRRLNYMSNIMVIKDPGNPENEGKVFLFKYGTKIFEKIQSAMKPQFEDETPMNPFDLWEGANFKLKIRKVEGYRNYDKSEFEAPAALASEEKLGAIWNAEHSLQEFLKPDKFKSYQDLASRLVKVLGTTVGSGISVLTDGVTVESDKPAIERTRTTAERMARPTAEPASVPTEDAAPAETKKETKATSTSSPVVDDDEEDDAAFFARLAKGKG